MKLKNLTRSVVHKLLLHRLPGPFAHEAGEGWIVELPRLRRRADRPDALCRSRLALYEDGIPLQPAHSLHADIRATGGGQFSHWQEHLRFSTSDNSDPNTNGRTYEYSLSPWLYSRRVRNAMSHYGLPVNHRPRVVSESELREEVAHALNTGRAYRDAMLRLLPSLQGKTVLEVGPGINYGASLFLGAFGTRPLVADRFLSPWAASYHPRFYTALRAEMARTEPAADLGGMDTLLRANAYCEEVITRVECPIETLGGAADCVDVVFSNAVLEHVYDVSAAARQLFRVTRPGGFGLHQVDFRDHRDFSRPLEYLLLAEHEFTSLFNRVHGECGNRWRAPEFHAWLAQAGFEVLNFEATVFSRPEYVQTLLPRLAAARSRFAGLGSPDLHVLSGFFQLRKPLPQGGGDVDH